MKISISCDLFHLKHITLDIKISWRDDFEYHLKVDGQSCVEYTFDPDLFAFSGATPFNMNNDMEGHIAYAKRAASSQHRKWKRERNS